MLGRRWGTFELVRSARALPATCIVRWVGNTSLSRSLRKVDLPDPDSPTRNTNSPFSTSRVTFSRAGRPCLGYDLVTLSKWITAPSHMLDELRTACYGANRAPVWPRDSLLA